MKTKIFQTMWFKITAIAVAAVLILGAVFLTLGLTVWSGKTDGETLSCVGDVETSGKHDREIEKTGLLGIGMGDWSAPSELQNGGETPTEATDTLYFMYFLDLMRKACRWRNRDDRRYRELYDELKELFDKKYLTPDGYSVCNHESLLAFLIDLGFHGEKELNNFAKQLSARVKEKGYFHECGIIGMRHLFHSLVKIGDFEVAYRILNQTEQPSYGSWIKAGNTTLAESWNDNMSKNHHMFSDVASFFIKSIAGIAYSYEGGLWVTVAPNGFGQMDFAKAEQKAPFGKLSSEWKKERGRIRLVLHIPENTPYRLIVPKGYRCDSEQRKADKIEFCFVKSGNESAE